MTAKERVIGSSILLSVIILAAWLLPIGQVPSQYLPLTRAIIGSIGLVALIVYNGWEG